jgi:hypothetical protein
MTDNAVYNPKNAEVGSLPVIYGFNKGGGWGPNDLEGALLAEDGTYLGGHICSSEVFMPGDLGILEGSRPDRHKTFRNHYPDGYRMEFVRGTDVANHAGLQRAFDSNSAAAPKERR